MLQTKIKSPFKIIGGKFAILDVLEANLPKNFNKIETYIEPFLGGGSLFLNLAANHSKTLKNFHINEFNGDIARVWTTLLSSEESELNEVQSILKEYHAAHQTDEKFYYKVRDSFNQVESSHLKKVAQFLYLNKTGFNGLIRYNSAGELNVPKGDYKNPNIEDISKLEIIRTLLSGIKVNLTHGDFQEALESIATEFEPKRINKKTFVYLDPPYAPKSVTANFTQYSPSNFTEYDQRRLAASLHMLDSLGAKFMLSNSDTQFTRDIFSGWNFVEVMNIRNVNCKGNRRQKVQELLIKNY